MTGTTTTALIPQQRTHAPAPAADLPTGHWFTGPGPRPDELTTRRGLVALPGADTFLNWATQYGRAVVDFSPAAPTRELALLAGVHIASWHRRPLHVVVDRHLTRNLFQAASGLDMTFAGVHTAEDYLDNPPTMPVVLVVLSEGGGGRSVSSQAVAELVAGSDMVVLRAAGARNLSAQAVVTARPYARYTPTAE